MNIILNHLLSFYIKLCDKLSLKDCVEEILECQKTKKIDEDSCSIAFELTKQALQVHQEDALLSFLKQEEEKLVEKKTTLNLVENQKDSDSLGPIGLIKTKK